MKSLLKSTLGLYQKFLSPLVSRGSCRFYPSCSHYALLSLDKYPWPKALLGSLRRLARCHPLNPGGIDFP